MTDGGPHLIDLGAYAYPALAAAAFLWAALSAWLLVDRAVHDRRWRRLGQALRRLQPAGAGAAGASRDPWVQTVLERVSRRTLERHAVEQSTPLSISQALAEHAMERDPARVLRQAWGHRGEGGRWRRIAALHILCRSGHADVMAVLRRALRDPDRDVVGAAVTLLGTVADTEAASLLVTALRGRLYPASRVAARLDRFPLDIAELIALLIRDEDPAARFWGAALLARYAARPVVAAALAGLCRDPDPNVRKAAIESLGRAGGEAALGAARELLQDPVWYVRAHAARALGDPRRAGLAPDLLPLLADEQWWVRAAAKDALMAMGPGAAPALAGHLDHPDRFARNGAAEVLQNLGVLDALAEQAEDAGLDASLLRRAAAAGGPVLARALASRASTSDRVRALLEGAGERQTSP